MSFFADLLSGVNDRIGLNSDSQPSTDAPVDLKLGFSSKPKSNIDLALERKWESEQTQASDDADVVVKVTEKNNRKLKINHGDCKTSLTFANDKMAAESIGKAVTEKDMKVDIGLGGEIKQAKGEWKITAKLNALASDLGGAKAGLNVDADYKSSGDIEVKPKLNLEISDEFNLGVSAKTDTKSLTDCWPQFVYKPKDDGKSFYWLRADITKQLIMAGCDQILRDGYQHSFEAVIGYGDKYEGIQGQKVSIRGGVEYELSDASSLQVSADFAKDYSISAETSHKLDKNWTVGCTQSFNSEDVAGKKNPYHMGFSASYKL